VLQCDAMYCRFDGMLQYVVVCYSVLQCVVMVCCTVLQRVIVCCSVLQCIADPMYVAVYCSTLQCVVVCCDGVLQCVAVQCNVLQCVAVWCNIVLRVLQIR